MFTLAETLTLKGLHTWKIAFGTTSLDVEAVESCQKDCGVGDQNQSGSFLCLNGEILSDRIIDYYNLLHIYQPFLLKCFLRYQTKRSASHITVMEVFR